MYIDLSPMNSRCLLKTNLLILVLEFLDHRPQLCHPLPPTPSSTCSDLQIRYARCIDEEESRASPFRFDSTTINSDPPSAAYMFNFDPTKLRSKSISNSAHIRSAYQSDFVLIPVSICSVLSYLGYLSLIYLICFTQLRFRPICFALVISPMIALVFAITCYQIWICALLWRIVREDITKSVKPTPPMKITEKILGIVSSLFSNISPATTHPQPAHETTFYKKLYCHKQGHIMDNYPTCPPRPPSHSHKLKFSPKASSESSDGTSDWYGTEDTPSTTNVYKLYNVMKLAQHSHRLCRSGTHPTFTTTLLLRSTLNEFKLMQKLEDVCEHQAFAMVVYPFMIFFISFTLIHSPFLFFFFLRFYLNISLKFKDPRR
uniref:Uncharacterized protein n=1 Tax=Cucumis melo TaxID=3656 RepID=A0A9I9E761_CUCME